MGLFNRGKKKTERLRTGGHLPARALLAEADKSGYLKKRGGGIKNWKNRLCILAGNRIFYYVNEKSNEPLGFVEIPSGDAVSRADSQCKKRNSMAIKSPKRTFFFIAPTENELESWIKAIKDQLADGIENVKENAQMKGALDLFSGKKKTWKKKYFVYYRHVLYCFRAEKDERPKWTLDITACSVCRADPERDALDRKSVLKITDLTHCSRVRYLSSTSAVDESEIEIWEVVLKPDCAQSEEDHTGSEVNNDEGELSTDLPDEDNTLSSSSSSVLASSPNRSMRSGSLTQSVRGAAASSSSDTTSHRTARAATTAGTSASTSASSSATASTSSASISISGSPPSSSSSVLTSRDAPAWPPAPRTTAPGRSQSMLVISKRTEEKLNASSQPLSLRDRNFSISRAEPVHKGWLTKQGGNYKSWKRRFFVMSNSTLFYMRNAEDREPLGFIDLKGRYVTRADDETQKPFSMKIITPSRTYYMYADTEPEIDRWLMLVKDTCKVTPSEVMSSMSSSEQNGWLTKRGGRIKSWRRRFCVLRGSILYYYKNRNDTEPKGYVDVAGHQVRRLRPNEEVNEIDKQHVIKIYTSERTWYMYADRAEEADEWAVALMSAALLMRGNTFIVDGRGDKGRFRTIKQAIEKARALDRIVIQAGNYTEHLVVNKPLIIEGVGDVVVEANNRSALVVSAPTARISNVAFRQCRKKDGLNCVEVNAGCVWFDYCDVRSEAGNCISVSGESHLLVRNSNVHRAGQYGIYCTGSTTLTLENSLIQECQWDGVMLMGDTCAIITSSKISSNQYNGISVSCSGRTSIEHNEINDNSWDGITVSAKRNTPTIYNNKVFRNHGYGIYIGDGCNAELIDNEAVDNVKKNVSISKPAGPSK